MTFRIEDPVWLWLLAGAVPFALVAFYAFTTMSRLRRWSAILTRALVLALLAAALAGASSIRRVDRAAMIVAIDTSGSVRAFVPDAAIVPPPDASGPAEGAALPILKALPQLLGQAERNKQQDLGADDTVTLFTFDAGPHVVTATGRVRDGTATLNRELTPATGSSEGSDLASAIRAAAAAVPPDAQSRILLISDGLAQPAHARSGGPAQESPQAAALSAARAAFAATRVPIDVVPLAFGDPREVIVESLDAPTRVASDRAPVPLTLTI
ncbi:MAG: VWA domain-containing protein, partial [Phycisphaerales bacterium]|nr:VWA domain-containing protein [Phycisphaerales bacterium]